MRAALTAAVGFAVLLWIIKTAESLLGLDLGEHGILARRAAGLDGILWAPLIHGSWAHLAANTGPVVILATALFYGYPRSARIVLPVIYLGTGVAVWLFARPVYHIGASGLTFGMMLFISCAGLLRRDKQAIALSLAALFLYGGMLGGLAPGKPGISFETHLSAAVLGVILAFALKDLDPPPPRKVYSWELEDEFSADEDDSFEYEYDEEPEDKVKWH